MNEFSFQFTWIFGETKIQTKSVNKVEHNDIFKMHIQNKVYNFYPQII